MKEKSVDEKPQKNRQVGYRVPKELLDKFDAVCAERGLDHQAQIRMMIEAWLDGGGAIWSTRRGQRP